MSFRSSITGLVRLVQKVLVEADEACGKHNKLTVQISSLQSVLNRLQHESADSKSAISRANKERKREIEEHTKRCKDILRVLDTVFTKYNSLSDEKKRDRKIWRKIRFTNGETHHLTDIRHELSALTAAILISVHLCSLKPLGKVEAKLGRIESHSNSHQLKGLRRSLHWIIASKAASGGEGSVWTSSTSEDDDFWKDVRRELVREGYDRTGIKRHKKLIQAYIEEIGNRGVFDELEQKHFHKIRVPDGGQLKADLNHTSEATKRMGATQSLLTRSTTPVLLPLSSVQVERVAAENLLGTGHSEVSDISILEETPGLEKIDQLLQSPDLQPTSEPRHDNLEFGSPLDSPTDSTFVLLDEIKITREIPVSPEVLSTKDPVLSANSDVSSMEECVARPAPGSLIDATRPEAPENTHLPSLKDDKHSGNDSQPPSIISPSHKPSTPKQVRFVDSDTYSRAIPGTKLSQATRKLPGSVRRLRNHFPLNNLSVSKY